MELNILTQQELDILQKIRTSRDDAFRILQRNEQLEQITNYWDSYMKEKKAYPKKGKVLVYYDSMIGCPHCSEEMDCACCAWRKAEKVFRPYPCLRASFGGVTYHDTQKLCQVDFGYCPGSEYLQIIGKGKRCSIRKLRYELSILRKYFIGHQEWAKAVLWPFPCPVDFDGMV